MKNLNKYIKEALVNHKVKVVYKYSPQTKEELKEAIQTELDKGNTDLNCIDTSEITDMINLFDQNNYPGIKLSEEQQETLDVSKWDVSNVTNMGFLFNCCKYFNCDLSNWDVSNVTNMGLIFSGCKKFNSDLSKWDLSNVDGTDFMFSQCHSFNQDISNWNMENVEYAQFMFFECKSFNQDLNKWKLPKLKEAEAIFKRSALEGNEPKWYIKFIKKNKIYNENSF